MKKSMMTEMASAPPPPPPSKGSRKMLIAAIVIAIVVVAVVVGAYLVMRGSNAPSNNNSTPSPGATATPSPGATATPSPGANAVGTASSLQFSIDFSHAGAAQGTYTYMAKNAGTSNLMIRVEVTDNESNTFTYIVNGAQQKAWVYTGGQWMDLSTSFSDQWSTWDTAFVGYRNSLAGWAGVGEWTYTDPNGDSLRYYNIAVNPALADSLFQPPS